MVKEKTLIIDPLLLNSGDGVLIEILSDSKLEIDNAVARVVGIAGISELERRMPLGLIVNLVEPSGPGSTRQKHVQEWSTLFVITTSFIASIITFFFRAMFIRTKRIAGKLVFGAISLHMCILAMKGSVLMPEALLGFSEKSWMDYVSIAAILLFGGVAAL